MVTESIYADGPEIAAIRAAARETRTTVSMGFSEKARSSTATLWNANILIGPDGNVLVHHRKLVPTFFEKLTWAPGDGFGLRVARMESGGNVGVLICGENTNPLARFALMAQAEQIHVSTWPPVWPTRVVDPEEPLDSAGRGDDAAAAGGNAAGKNYDNVAANRTRAAAHSFEAKCFGVLCAGVLDALAIDIIAEGASSPTTVRRTLENSPRGVTMFLDPTGAPQPAFIVNKDSRETEEKEYLQHEEGLLYADLDLERCVEGKQFHDVVGGYQRGDVFDLRVRRERTEVVCFSDRDGEETQAFGPRGEGEGDWSG
jgi:predicted amidohydrolase